MQPIQKDFLKNEISIMLKKAKIDVDDLKVIKKDEELIEYIDLKVLEVSDAVLRWAWGKQIISENSLKTDDFSSFEDIPINKQAVGGVSGVGAVGAGALYNVAAAPVFLGFGGGIGAIGLAGAAGIAAPLVVAGIGLVGFKKYNEKKQMREQLVEHFENEKKKILKFYLERIDNIKLSEN